MFNKLGFVASPPATTSNGGKNMESSVNKDDNIEIDAEGSVPISADPDESVEPPELVSAKKSDGPRRKRSRRRRKGKSRNKVEPISQKEKQQQQQQLKDPRQKQQHQQAAATSKKQHDAPMTKRDLYFALKCETVGIARTSQDVESQSSAVARVTVVNWENQVVLDTFVQVPVPVSDFRTSTSGIVPADVYSAQAMSFAHVRATVERIITGKILIGHNVETDLAALGLSHPWCDVRDTASFAPFLGQFEDPVSGQRVVRPRALRDLASTILKRELPEPKVRTRPLDDCIACLDLYKAYRCEWEQDLVKRAQQNEAQQQLETSHAVNNRHRHASLYGQNHALSPNDFHRYQVPHQNSQHRHQAQRPRIPSYEMLPPNLVLQQQQQIHPPSPSYSLGDGASQHQIIPAFEAHSSQGMQMSQSSWFRRSRKPRYVPLSPSPSHQQHHPTASTALSAQAMEVLSGLDVPPHTTCEFEYQASSWSYDDSTLLDASTDYESSTLYEESVASGSIAFYQPEEAQRATDAEEYTGSGSGIAMQQQQSSEASSWFRFGSKRPSRLQQQQRQQLQQGQSLGVLQELAEEQQQHLVEGLKHAADSSSVTDPLQVSRLRQATSQGKAVASNYEPPKYFASIERPAVAPEKPASSGSGWFGFRRSKSPRTNRDEEEKDRDGSSDVEEGQHAQPFPITAKDVSDMTGITEEVNHCNPEEQPSTLEPPQALVKQNFITTVHDQNNPIAPSSFFSKEQITEESLLQDSKAQQEVTVKPVINSWFGFRRSRSPNSKDRQRGHDSASSSGETDNCLPEQETMRTDSTEATEEDWLREVMCQPGDKLNETAVETQLFVTQSGTGRPAENGTSLAQDDTIDFGRCDRTVAEFDEMKDYDNTMASEATKEEPREDQDKHVGGERQLSSNWFRFLRKGATSAPRQVSRLDFAAASVDTSSSVPLNEDKNKVAGANMNFAEQKMDGFESFTSTQMTSSSSFEEDEDNTSNCQLELPLKVESTRDILARSAHEDWLEEVVAPSSLDSGWFGFPEDPRSRSPFTTSENSPTSTRSTTTVTEGTHATPAGTDGGVAGLENLDTFLRARLCTDSTLPTVASEEEDDLRDFVHGMEKNFSFLNI